MPFQHNCSGRKRTCYRAPRNLTCPGSIMANWPGTCASNSSCAKNRSSSSLASCPCCRMMFAVERGKPASSNRLPVLYFRIDRNSIVHNSSCVHNTTVRTIAPNASRSGIPGLQPQASDYGPLSTAHGLLVAAGCSLPTIHYPPPPPRATRPAYPGPGYPLGYAGR